MKYERLQPIVFYNIREIVFHRTLVQTLSLYGIPNKCAAIDRNLLFVFHFRESFSYIPDTDNKCSLVSYIISLGLH